MLSLSTLLVWLGVSWFLHGRILHEADEIYDGQLQQSGRILSGLIRAGAWIIGLPELRAALPAAGFDGIPQVHSLVDRNIRRIGKYERVIGFQILDRSGALLFRSPGAPGAGFPVHRDEGFSDAQVDGVRWRICSFRDDASHRVIHIGEQYAVRQEISSYLLRSMRVPVLLVILVIGILIWLSVDRGLKPLSVLADQVRKRKPDDFSPLEPVSPSTEIRPIVDALNTLLARVRGTFDAERRFAGDAAHELRTPLAALKVQTQVALGATHEHERRSALNGILAGVDRAAHLVSQLLDLSRLDWQQRPEARGGVDLTEETESVSSELAPYARRKGVDVAGGGDPETPICAHEPLVSMLVRNLLDNAIRYADSGGRVTWTVTRQPAHILLEIADTGPGIRPDKRQAVFERFCRLPGSRGSGAGLGLSIVGKIADLYGAEISLADSETGSGLRVLVRFALASLTKIQGAQTAAKSVG